MAKLDRNMQVAAMTGLALHDLCIIGLAKRSCDDWPWSMRGIDEALDVKRDYPPPTPAETANQLSRWGVHCSSHLLRAINVYYTDEQFWTKIIRKARG